LLASSLVLPQILDVVERELVHPHSSGTQAAPDNSGAAGARRVGVASVELLEALGEPAGVALLRSSQRLQPFGHLLEAFLAGGAGKAGVHLGVLVGLALDRRLQVVRRPADLYARHGIADFGEEVEVSGGWPVSPSATDRNSAATSG